MAAEGPFHTVGNWSFLGLGSASLGETDILPYTSSPASTILRSPGWHMPAGVVVTSQSVPKGREAFRNVNQEAPCSLAGHKDGEGRPGQLIHQAQLWGAVCEVAIVWPTLV